MDIELGMIYIERNYIRNELIKKEKIYLKKNKKLTKILLYVK